MSTEPVRPHRLAVFGIDLVVVLAFAAIGRLSHHEDLSVTGYLTTAWPFILGLAAGSAIGAATHRRPDGFAVGGIVWVSTLVIGMILRLLSGQGAALPFVIVATLFLGLAFFAWRLVAMLVRRGRSRAS
ncbi:DUF3054 domain-containing protein [Microbacterium phosphatis]|uniref:DUF3054 domain-containing protein n=1 Tax=Microbacterium phosphatis TaxID=3140248 RepID=UPI00314011E2